MRWQNHHVIAIRGVEIVLILQQLDDGTLHRHSMDFDIVGHLFCTR